MEQRKYMHQTSPNYPAYLKYLRAEAVPSAARIAKLLNLGRIDEVRTSVVALQIDAKAAKAELKLAEQTAGIATRDYNELWERFQHSSRYAHQTYDG
jgi:hypothetical protein